MGSINKSQLVPFVVVLAFRIAAAILPPVLVLFLYDSICQQLYPEELLANNTNNTTCSNKLTLEAQDAVQKEATNYFVAMRLLQNIPAFVMCLYCGGWIDRIGHRLPMILSCLGGIGLMIAFALIQVTDIPAIPAILVGVTVYAVVGPNTLVPAAAESYITARTTSIERTRHLGYLMAINYIGLVIGSLILAGLVDEVPFWGLFACVGVFFGLTAFLVTFALPGDNPDDNSLDAESAPIQQKLEPAPISKKASSVSLYELENLKSSLRTFTRERPDNLRRYLWLALSGIVIIQFAGELDLLIFFVRHAPLNWSQSEYGYVMSFQYAIGGLTLVILLPILLNKFQLSDAIVVVVCSILKAFGLAFLAFSDLTWMVYFANIFLALYGVLSSCLRSIMSKIVDADESGRCFNVIASVENVSELVGVFVFTRLYYLGLSLTSWHGQSLPFVVMSVFHLILAGLALYIYFGVADKRPTSSEDGALLKSPYDSADSFKDKQIQRHSEDLSDADKILK